MRTFKVWDQLSDTRANFGMGAKQWRNFNINWGQVGTLIDAEGYKEIIYKNTGSGLEIGQIPGQKYASLDITGNKFLIIGELKCESNFLVRHEVISQIPGAGYYTDYSNAINVSGSSQFVRFASVCTITSSMGNRLKFWAISVYGIPVNALVYTRNVMCFNLTEMYGPGNEPSITEFLKQYPAKEYKFNEFKLMLPVE